MRTIKIKTVQELFKVNDFVVAYDTSEYIFSLENDIDLRDCQWVPIGIIRDHIFPFLGVFEGNRHVIKNLKVTGFDKTGFIAKNKGKIENLFLDHTCSFVSAKAGSTGSICGDNNGSIIGCKSAANVSGVTSVGGICGYFNPDTYNSVIRECSFFGDVRGAANVGGICGCSTGNGYQLTNRGTVYGKENVGGIVGLCSTNSEYIEILNTGKVTGERQVRDKFGLTL
jgi:hypothetical protein